MIDHIYLPVFDLERSSEFYKKLLEPLGIDMPYKFDQVPQRGFAINNIPGFWLRMAKSPKIFTSHSPPGARTLSGPPTRRR